MASFITTEALPGETAALTPAIEPFEQQLSYGFFEAIECTAVVRYSKIVEVTPQLAGDGLPELRQRTGVAFLAEPLGEGDQGATQPLL
jgi:hypothetical protein